MPCARVPWLRRFSPSRTAPALQTSSQRRCRMPRSDAWVRRMRLRRRSSSWLPTNPRTRRGPPSWSTAASPPEPLCPRTISDRHAADVARQAGAARAGAHVLPRMRPGVTRARTVSPTIGDMTMAEAQLDDLRRRLVRLEDLEAIRRLKAQYLNACDSQDPESAKSCFAEGEVTIDMGHVGVFRTRDEFAALYRAAGCHPHVLDM